MDLDVLCWCLCWPIFVAPFGKIPVLANIIIAADNYTLYVNGESIDQGYNLRETQGYCVKLESGHKNVFVVALQNLLTQQLLLPLSTSLILTVLPPLSDAGWRANSETAGFESIGFDDPTWPNAIDVGNADSPPCGMPSPPSVPAGSPTSNAPAGSFAFRKTYKVSSGSLVQSGKITIDADNGYTLYINGNEIGSGHNWPKVQRWTFTLKRPTADIVLAITATNNKESPAGFIVAVALDAYHYDCSRALVKVTDGTPDGTWKFNLGVRAGFQQPGYDDSNLPSTIVEGPYGVAPWAFVPIVNSNENSMVKLRDL